MGRFARRALSRLWMLFFLGAIALMVFKDFDGGHKSDGYLTGNAMVLCQMGLAGVVLAVTRELRGHLSPGGRARREAAEMLLRALESTPPQPEEDLGLLRPVGGSPRAARRSSTPADEGSGRRPGA